MDTKQPRNFGLEAVARHWLAIVTLMLVAATIAPLLRSLLPDDVTSSVELTPSSGGRDAASAGAVEANDGPTAALMRQLVTAQDPNGSVSAQATGTRLRIVVRTSPDHSTETLASDAAQLLISATSAEHHQQLSDLVRDTERELESASADRAAAQETLGALIEQQTALEAAASAEAATEDDRAAALQASAEARQAQRDLDDAGERVARTQRALDDARSEQRSAIDAFTVRAGPTEAATTRPDIWTWVYTVSLAAGAVAAAGIALFSAFRDDLRSRDDTDHALRAPVLGTVYVERRDLMFDDPAAVAALAPVRTAVVGLESDDEAVAIVAEVLGRHYENLGSPGLVGVGRVSRRFIEIPDVDQVIMVVRLGTTRRRAVRRLEDLLTRDSQPVTGVLLARGEPSAPGSRAPAEAVLEHTT